MAALDSLSGVGSSGGGQRANAYSAMTSDDFAKIIFTELSKQDPLQPSDTNALIQQISSIRSIQSNTDLSANLGTLVKQNEFASAATLVGKTVSGLTDRNERVTGVVKAVARTNDGAVVELADGSRVSSGRIDQIRETPAATTP